MMTRKIFFTFLLLSNALLVSGQRPEADSFKMKKGNLVIQPILHGTLAFQYEGNLIYVDPYGGAEAFQGIAKPNLILITDIHGDHLNEETLDAINTEGIKIVVPQAVADQIAQKYHSQLVILANGEHSKQLGIGIEAIPMYNLPESADAKHVKGRGNGYLLHIGKKKVYISGDTADIAEMRELKDIDIAFVCMNLPYTMTIDQAASAVLDFKPKVVYPYHYRGNPDMSDTEAFKKLVNDQNPEIDVRLRNWYPEY
jgi:L-ascorbate metabolism protein UlaG (beta-lactamase superfamily)